MNSPFSVLTLVAVLAFAASALTNAEEGGALLGDCNQDGVVNALDVDPFVFLVSNGIYQIEADCNQDDEVNLLDIDVFSDILASPPEGFDDCLLGDVNGDGAVDLLDVNPFIHFVANGNYSCAADCNEDGAVNLLDIDPFIALVAGG